MKQIIEQIIITSSERCDFQLNVNNKLADGWKVVPGTSACSVSICNYSGHYDSAGHTHTKDVESWMIVLEKI